MYSEASKLKSTKSTISEISQAYGLNEKDLEFWFAETDWATKPVISRKELNSSMEKMVELGILKSIQKPEDFLIMDRLTVEN